MESVLKNGNRVHLLAVMVLTGLSPPVAAIERTWPDSVPCNGAKRACFDAWAHGNTVLLGTNKRIVENLSTNKPLASSEHRAIHRCLHAVRFSGNPALSGWNVETGGLSMPTESSFLYRAPLATDASIFKNHEVRIPHTAPIPGAINMNANTRARPISSGGKRHA